MLPALTEREHDAADSLVREMYMRRGYHFQSLRDALDNPYRLTLAAWQGGAAVATLTLTRDSHAGLLADGLYAPELDSLRQAGRVICEVTRLAADPGCSGAALLADLFATALEYGEACFGASDAVIEVNPRHVRFYQARYGFRRIGKLRQCPRVDAPAVLMHQRVGALASMSPA